MKLSCSLKSALAIVAFSLAPAACGRNVLAPSSTASTKFIGNATPGLATKSTVTGHLDPVTQLDLRIGIKMRDPNGLDAFLADVYDPQSPSYQQYLTPDEFAARFMPSQEDVDKVRSALLANGFDVDDHAHGALLMASATSGDAEAFFHTNFSTFADPDGRPFYAPDTDIAVDDALPIENVSGLHTVFPQIMDHRYGDLQDQSSATSPYMTAANIRSVYNIPASATGAGQVIALYELDGYNLSDITDYAQSNGIQQIALQNMYIDGYSGAAGSGAGEVTIDIELINAMMPEATQLRVFEAAQGAGAIDEWNELANPTLGDKMLMPIISTSWGLPEDESSSSGLQLENNIFKQMAAQGQTVIAASGDSGALDDGQTLGVDDPSSQPYVLAAGGTTLKQSNGAYQSEASWSGSGGGVSSVWPIPSWQQGHISAASGGSATMRNVPDVSLDADPSTGYLFYYQGTQGLVGGTSCSAPLWAAFLTLTNQARAAAGLGKIGFATPALYGVGTSSAYATTFHDVQSGNNGHYNAVAGLDNATGWGSFNGAALMSALSAGTSSGTGSGSGSGSGSGTGTGSGTGSTAATSVGPITLAENTGYCIDLSGDNTTNGTKLQTWGCNGSAAQSVTYGDGHLNVSGKCIQAAASSSGSLLSINDCSSVATQQWSVIGETIVLANTNLCIDVPSNLPGNGVQLHVWSCNGTAAQNWNVKGLKTSTLRPTTNTGYCLDVRGSGTADGTPVQIWPCNGTAAQSWTAGAGRLSALGRCFGVTSGAAGTGIGLYSCTETNGESWVANGSTWQLSGTSMCLAVPNNNLAAGQQVELETCGSSGTAWTEQ